MNASTVPVDDERARTEYQQMRHEYIAAANTYYASTGAVLPTWPTFCPECGDHQPADNDVLANHVYADNGVLLIGCEGYHVQNPNTFGMAAPNWQNWQDNQNWEAPRPTTRTSPNSEPSACAWSTSEVWVLRHDDTRTDEITLYSTYEAGLASLAHTILSRWDNITRQQGVPSTPDGLSNLDAVNLYFQHRAGIEYYLLYSDTVNGYENAADQHKDR